MQCSPIMEAHYAMLVLGTHWTQCWGPSGPPSWEQPSISITWLRPTTASKQRTPQCRLVHVRFPKTEVSVQHSFVLVVYSGVIEKAFLSFIRAARIEWDESLRQSTCKSTSAQCKVPMTVECKSQAEILCFKAPLLDSSNHLLFGTLLHYPAM